MATTSRVRDIPLEPSRSYLKWRASGRTDFSEVAAVRSPPFAVNPRGVLTHRVRHLTTYYTDGRLSHHHADYLCGNGCNFRPDAMAEVLVANPPAGRLLCDYCETRARKKKLPSGDALAGRHVHRGVLVPRRVCCTPKVEPASRGTS